MPGVAPVAVLQHGKDKPGPALSPAQVVVLVAALTCIAAQSVRAWWPGKSSRRRKSDVG